MKMKKLLIGALAALLSVAALATTPSPVSLLNTAGSTAGQAVVSPGPAGPAGWGNVSAAALTGITPIVNGGTACGTASGTCLDNITGFSGTGFLTRTGAGAYAFQSTTNGITLGNLAQAAANTVLANVTGSTANVTAFSMPTCNTSVSALNYTPGTGWICNAGLITAATVSSTYLPTATAASTYATIAQATTALAATGGSITGVSGSFTTLSASSGVTGIPGRLLNVQVFSASGTYTPTSGTTHAIIKVQAPGGGSGGTTTTGASTISISAAGSAGSYAEAYWSSPTSQTVTIGTAGSAGAAAGAGGTGGTTSIGSIVSCPGGVGGAVGAANTPPFMVTPAASPSACTVSGPATILSIAGGRGQFGISVSTTASDVAPGGIGYLGSGNFGTASGYGSGGGSASIGISASGAAGFAGSPAVVIAYDYQ